MSKNYIKFLLIILLSMHNLLLYGANINSDCKIKGNISFETGEKIYHLPGCKYYDETIIDESYGEKYFCTEQETVDYGWTKSKVCNINSNEDNSYILLIIIGLIIFAYFYYKKPD